MDPYDECFDIQEKKILDAHVLKFVVNEMEKIHHNFGDLRECPFYCSVIRCLDEDGWIVGAIFGGVCILVLFVMVIVKMNKRTVRRIGDGGWK